MISFPSSSRSFINSNDTLPPALSLYETRAKKARPLEPAAMMESTQQAMLTGFSMHGRTDLSKIDAPPSMSLFVITNIEPSESTAAAVR